MRVISIVGKIDTRVLAYPLARALSLNGQTAMIADDGAYRRLFHGKGDTGTVSGIDVAVTSHMDDTEVHKLDKSGINYDNLIVVANDYIHPESTGIIVCHGLDRSMMAKDEVEEDDDFILPLKPDTEEPKDTPKPKSGGLLGKGKHKSKAISNEEVADTSADEPEGKAERGGEPKGAEDTGDIAPEPSEPIERDQIEVPANVPYVEVQVAYAAAPKKDILGISLKEGLMGYIYTCEEQKQLGIITDKNYNGIIAKIASSVCDIDQKEFSMLLAREEGKTLAKKKR